MKAPNKRNSNKKLYLYESHLDGDFYILDYKQDYDELYCETCGDSDTLLRSGTKDKIITDLKDGLNSIVEEGADEWELTQYREDVDRIMKLLEKY